MTRWSRAVGVLGLGALFSALVDGCGGESDVEETSSDPPWCDPFEEEHVVTTTQDLSGIALVDGLYPESLCQMLCNETPSDGFLLRCEPSDGSEGGSMSDESGGGTASTSTGEESSTDGGSEDAAGTESDSGDSDSTGAEDTTTGAPESTVVCVFEVGYCDVGGRLSTELRSSVACTSRDALARWAAGMAHSEAASIVSFLRLARALAAHGAPAELVDRCRAAAVDEARHARIMRRLARAMGAVPTRPVHAPEIAKDLETLARENATEGCVRETWSALLVTWQAGHACDASVRSQLAAIALDETRHAELAWELHRWLLARLPDDARARVEAAMQRTADDLREASLRNATPAIASVGLPGPAQARRLVASLTRALW